ncbi:ferrous iron transport protein B [Granulicatella balaenopterae]|uniref:Ferrous iron transport protein B n=1 Tax=Granulicatella balaenopterae TaxID=137733 RepID=A0A1H9JBD8_9LACT|nr:ferrous iron transport protein B [Granulicatella balaenopterae]SEQ84093.1 ferrous iron transport protein B [Granulicatella balaenopterae]
MTVIALVGNPNSGKTTLFNALTGMKQKVGNWPGVTIDKKEGILKGHNDVKIVDLPGIYSLSPYTAEEVISRDFLLHEKVDLILNVVDATNLERNLYLTTQLMELGLPVVVGLNMMDIVEKNDSQLSVAELQYGLDLPVVEISATTGKGIDGLIQAVTTKQNCAMPIVFSKNVESTLLEITERLFNAVPMPQLRYWTVKVFEKDKKVNVSELLDSDNKAYVDGLIKQLEEQLEDDSESIVARERYDWIETLMASVSIEMNMTDSISDEIDRIVTNRWLGLPIFAFVMFLVYYFSISTIGTMGTDWTNEVLFGEIVPEAVTGFLESINIHPLVIGLIVDGAIAGVGAVLGFLPQMAALFLCLAILEDCGYMARVAFVMDRVFRKFGLSGKSFIPLLIGTGCSVPGIQASRTIENEENRKITIITTSFIPCGAKLPVIALIANAIFNGSEWVAFSMYALGICSVLLSGVVLQKLMGVDLEPKPFIMELPSYHWPHVGAILRSVLDKVLAFIKRAGTVIFVSSCIIWITSTFNFRFEEVEDAADSMLAIVSGFIAPIFIPLGFGDWQSTTATIQGFVAKENVLSTMGVLFGIAEEVSEESGTLLNAVASHYTVPSAISLLVFNMLCMPCFAAVGAMKTELKSKTLALKAVLYQTVFAYTWAYVFFEFAKVIVGGYSFGISTVIAMLVIVAYAIILFYPVDKWVVKYKGGQLA